MITRYSSAVAVCFLLASFLAYLVLLEPIPLAGLAAPRGTFQVEAVVSLTIFLSLVVVAEPLETLMKTRLRLISRVLGRPIRLRRIARAIAFFAMFSGLFVFAFWATADVLGGYNGYTVSFAEHPYLQEIYNAVGLRHLGSWDVGSEASVFFTVALLGFIALRANMGLGNALKDSVTLFAAPILVAFELSLWFFAPDDMTWHVIDALWIGGVNDMGWRAFDPPGGGAFLISNWFVLLICILLIASRVPFLGVPSRVLWRRRALGHESSESIRGQSSVEVGITRGVALPLPVVDSSRSPSSEDRTSALDRADES